MGSPQDWVPLHVMLQLPWLLLPHLMFCAHEFGPSHVTEHWLPTAWPHEMLLAQDWVPGQAMVQARELSHLILFWQELLPAQVTLQLAALPQSTLPQALSPQVTLQLVAWPQ